MRGHVITATAAALLLALSAPAFAQRIETRMLLTSGVACRTAPQPRSCVDTSSASSSHL